MKNLTLSPTKEDNSVTLASSTNSWIELFLLIFVLFFTSCTDKKTPLSNTDTSINKEKVSSVPKKDNNQKTILFFGNSLTAGYGLSPNEGFAGLVAQRIDSLQLPYKVVNAGLSGETTSGGNERIDWMLENTSVDIFVLELGANDALRGLPVKDAKANLQSIISKVKTMYPSSKIVLAGMLAPPNMGKEYIENFAAIYPSLAKENNAALIPFLLDGVAGNPNLNLPDGIHPNLKGHQIVLENVWRVLETVL